MGESGIFYSHFRSLGNLVWGIERATLTLKGVRGLHSGAVAPSGPSSARAPDEFTARLNVLLDLCTNYSRN